MKNTLVQSIPKVAFPGGVLVGCSAGFLNVAKLKGTHNAIGSGIQAAESINKCLEENADKPAIYPEKVCFVRRYGLSDDYNRNDIQYDADIRAGPIMKELKAVRNLRPSFNSGGLWAGVAYNALSYLTRGLEPWTFSHTSPFFPGTHRFFLQSIDFNL